MTDLQTYVFDLLHQKGVTDVDVSLSRGVWMRESGDIVRGVTAVNLKDLHAFLAHRYQDSDLVSILNQLGGQDDFGFLVRKGEQAIRVRAHMYLAEGKPALALRRLQDQIPDIASLGLPDSIERVLSLKQGLVLVTGPTGSGKTTTLAAILDAINAEHAYKIITLEAPIEYVHPDRQSTVRQRLVDVRGGDCVSFAKGVESAMREDPDVILVGEMRDYETVSAAMTAAQTGHLVFGTLHTNSGAETISRLLSSFPQSERDLAKSILASVFRCVISQRLLKTGQSGVVLASEIIHVTQSIRAHILAGNTHLIDQDVRNGQQNGQRSLNRSLQTLVLEGWITRELALATSNDVGELEDLI